MDNIVLIIILALIIIGDVLAAVILISRKRDGQNDLNAEGLARLEYGISSSSSNFGRHGFRRSKDRLRRAVSAA